jgi:hypothetical protein
VGELIDHWGVRPNGCTWRMSSATTVDIDTVDNELQEPLRVLREHGGDRLILTFPSDAAPCSLFEQCPFGVLNHGMEFSAVLPLFPSNVVGESLTAVHVAAKLNMCSGTAA